MQISGPLQWRNAKNKSDGSGSKSDSLHMPVLSLLGAWAWHAHGALKGA